MIVVSDTSPLRYLILIEHVYVLPALYGQGARQPGVEPRRNLSAGTSDAAKYGVTKHTVA